MKWYKLVHACHDGDNTDTHTIIDKMNGRHYNSYIGENAIYREFAVQFTDEELLMARLSLGPQVSIDVFVEHEIAYLTDSGFIYNAEKA